MWEKIKTFLQLILPIWKQADEVADKVESKLEEISKEGD